MLDEMKNMESSLVYVNFMTGLAAFLFGTIFFLVVKIDAVTEENARLFLGLSSEDFFVVIIFVFLGFFIYGIRYLFFELYRNKIFKKVKARQEKKNKKRLQQGKEIPKEFKREEGHTPFSWLVKYAFRNGTTVEEAIKANKRYKKEMKESGKSDEFEWVGTSGYPSFDMWKYANYISNRHPKSNIYRFYYHSEVFQCLDTLFLFFFIIGLGKLIQMTATSTFSSIKQLVALCIYIFVMFIFHRLSKISGKACIRRFFLEIAVGLTDCNDIQLPSVNQK